MFISFLVDENNHKLLKIIFGDNVSLFSYLKNADSYTPDWMRRRKLPIISENISVKSVLEWKCSNMNISDVVPLGNYASFKKILIKGKFF